MKNLKSEVEVNQKLILSGDTLFYVDNSNCQKFQVIDLFEGGFFATEDGYSFESFYFNELQLGWSISQKSKDKNFLEKRFRYAN